MSVTRIVLAAALILSTCVSSPLGAEGFASPLEPVAYTYAQRGTRSLQAYVFSPPKESRAQPRAAILILHGGGWTTGEASWCFPRARQLAGRGLVAVAVQYRLSEPGSVTPQEALDDVRDAFRWVRGHAESLGVDPRRVAAYGWSAGGHLAAMAAIFPDSLHPREPSTKPDALVLVSPAVSLRGDVWFQKLLGMESRAEALSPADQVRPGLPPMIILQGDVDTVTPLAGARLFCNRLRASGNHCELVVYEGYGHLFTPAGISDSDWPKPDPKTTARVLRRCDEFLISRSFMQSPSREDSSQEAR